ncbi:unnamed protein product, partial [Iphiclides podalirius]
MNINEDKTQNDILELNGNLNQETTRKTWVKFDDESSQTNEEISKTSSPSTSVITQNQVPAVLNTETVHVNLERGDRNLETPQAAANKNIEFVNIRSGFSNGDLLVTVLPVNANWPWITAARFRPELVPEELMAQGLTLTVEEYVHAMELLVNDAQSEEGKTIMQGWEQRLDVSVNDIVIQGSQSTRLSRKQDMAEQVYLRYLQRWGKDFLRRRLYWTLDEEATPWRGPHFYFYDTQGGGERMPSKTG